jgi:hypothetical protein
MNKGKFVFAQAGQSHLLDIKNNQLEHIMVASQ